MKLAVSNIAWSDEQALLLYSKMKNCGFEGIEIAPTRWIAQSPYDFPEKAQRIKCSIERKFGLSVPSMQSIWYGRKENLFGTDEERNVLLWYTKKAIDFAKKIECGNLVFGCPRNRYLPENMLDDAAVPFFKEVGDYAYEHNTVLSVEANPPIYNTNYINTTNEAIELVKRVNSPGFLLNLDLGTIIQNKESLGSLSGNESLIHHIHISEPGLCPIQKREIHLELAELLNNINYSGFVSIEMGKVREFNQILDAMTYVKEIFG